MKKIPALILAILTLSQAAFSQAKKSAETLKNESLKQDSIQDAITYLKNNTSSAETPSDTRSIIYYTGTLQELLGLYSEASASYVKAAAIKAQDAKNMPKVSSEQIVIDAIRTSLSSGDWENAQNYLNSAVKFSKDEKILAHVNLYSVWCTLCKAQTIDDTKDSIELLKAYKSMSSMKSIRPQVLVTLWHLTGNDSYAQELKRDFPASPECAIVQGKAEIMSVPFWYFVPRGESKTVQAPVKAPENTAENSNAKKAEKKLQLGLFRNQKNASNLMDKLKSKGFSSYSITKKGEETGTTYYIVIVDENSNGTMEKQLKSAGFDCYPIK